jgi:hypothetical protein
VSGHSLAGLLALNFSLLVVGAAVLFALRGLRTWNVFVFELVVGLDFSLTTILATEGVLTAAGLIAGRALGRPTPGARLTLTRMPLAGAAFAALTVVYAEALFRSGRLAGLQEFDGWAFWVPKAKAIYFFGGLDHQFFAELPGQSYPPLVPAFEATAFHFMGSPDVVTLHLQFWFFLMGFVAAVVGLLSARVTALLLFPPLLLLLATPHVLRYGLQAEGDFLLDELLALACLLVALWLVDGERWQLVATALLLGAAMSTKREGYVLAACIVLAALAASSVRARRDWPALLLTAAAAVAVTIPWRVLLAVRHLPSGRPEAGGTGLFSHLDRAWPSLRLALSTLFDFDIWLVVAPVALAAIVVALAVQTRPLGLYALVLFILAVAAFTWTTWAFPSLPITKQASLNPMPRLTGSLAFAATALVPVLLGLAWRPQKPS